MRALRSSLYVSAYEPPVTTVAFESDFTDTLESAIYGLRVPGGLVIHEIFDTDAPDIVTVTFEATQRQRANAEQEAHQAMLFYWTVSQWRIVAPGGTLFMDKPAPLARDEIVEVFEQLAQHPDYDNFHVVTHTRDGEPVTLANGKVQDGTS